MNRLDALLGELKDADPPPPGLVRNVMVTIESRRHRGMSHRLGETRMAKKVLIGLAAAAAVFIAVFTKTGWPPVGSGTEGTIGAAKRHQAQQLSASDVKLGDPSVQEFLQSDLAARLMNDAQARALLANAGVREALADAKLREALSAEAVRTALGGGAVRQALGDAQVREVIASAQLRELLSDKQLREALGDARVREALSSARLREALEESGVQGSQNSASLLAFKQDPAFAAAFQDKAFLGAVESGLLGRALQDTMLSTPAGLKAIGQAFDSGALAAVLENAALAQALENGVVAQALGNSQILAALQSGAIAQALGNQVIAQALGNQGFSSALQSQALRSGPRRGRRNTADSVTDVSKESGLVMQDLTPRRLLLSWFGYHPTDAPAWLRHRPPSGDSCSRTTPAHAQLATVETPEVRLVYFDGTESYLVPHVARAFLNALQFERGLFGYDPHEPITVLLADFSDAGNAAAGSVPRNLMAIQIAPLNFAFETIATNERMTTLMDHELVHVVTMDQAVRPRSSLQASVPGQGHADRRAP